VETVERVSSEQAPQGSKGPLADLGGWLAVHVGPTALTAVLQTLAGWVSRNDDRTVEITLGGDTLKLTGVSSQQQQQVIDDWRARQAART
jgi:hypothetical protein